MFSYHPKLISIMTEQTPRAMIALMIVSSIYIWIFFDLIPLNLLFLWLFFQILLSVLRIYNNAALNKYLEKKDTVNIKKYVNYFYIIIIFQAFTWASTSLMSLLYAPPPYELVTFLMLMGVITAAVLSLSSLFYIYLAFFFCIIIPQMIIMLYYGERQHIVLVVFMLIYIPTIVLLSKYIFKSHIGAIKTNEALEQNVLELRKLSTIDVLTNIYNRRYFFEVSHNIIELALREKKSVALLMIDLDFFKKINDDYGHQAGDFILTSLSETVKKIMRESDVFARVGGEEFAVLLHNTSEEGAKIIAETIRETLEKKTFTFNGTQIKLTVSIGVSTLAKFHPNIEKLYKDADDRLYKAKRDGRNRVC